MVMIQAGILRGTEDIDLLIDSSLGNQATVRRALQILPEKPVNELRGCDLERYLVVHVADKVIVDPLLSAGENGCAEAHAQLVSIFPEFPSPLPLLNFWSG